MGRLRTIIGFVLATTLATAQNETNIWYFGQNAGIDFTGAPVPLVGPLVTQEGCASISDVGGNLLFYTDGQTVWDATNTIMPNGNGLLGAFSSTQSALIIPDPGNANEYYIFTTPTGGPMRYTKVDMTANFGNGDVINAQKNIVVFNGSSERQTAFRHANCDDYWVVGHGAGNNNFYSVHVSATGVAAPVVSAVGMTPTNSIGQMKAAPNGDFLVLAAHGGGWAQLFDFDNNTGVVSNAQTLISGVTKCYGASFSQSSQRVYVTCGTNYKDIYQYDVTAGNIPASQQFISTSGASWGGSLQMGKDCKIYFSHYSTPTLGVINNPEVLGVGCNYVDNGFNLGGQTSRLGLPGFVETFFQYACTNDSLYISFDDTTNCDTVSFSVSNLFGLDSAYWDFGDPPSGPQNNSTLFNPTHIYTSGGTFNVSVIVWKDCIVDTLYTTVDPQPCCTPPTLVGDSTWTLCFDSCNGSATVHATGAGPFTYQWDANANNQTDSTASGLCAGSYTVVVTDTASCVDSITITVLEPPALTVTLATVNSNCGQADGSATVNPAGGTPGYTYQWDANAANQTTQTANNLASGPYSVTITDANGCTLDTTVTVNDNGGITSFTTNVIQNVSCNGLSDGSAGTAVTGGTSPYTYTWSTSGNTTGTETNMPAGVHSVTVTDNNGCTASANVTINEPTPLVLNISGNDVLCNGGTTGDATVTANGGTTPYTYAWSSSGNTTNVETNLPAGTYTVTVTDNNGCADSINIVIGEPAVLTTNTSVTSNYNGEDVSCFGSIDGQATNTGGGGVTPYNYTWSSSGNNTPVENNLGAGTYYLTLTDANGCFILDTVTLTEPTQLALNITAQSDADCFGAATASATAVATGGTQPYSYQWNNSATDTTNANIPAGNYTVTVTDANGCEAYAQVTVNEPAELIANVDPWDVSCAGNCDGRATASAIGGTPSYSYLWSTSANDTLNQIVDLCVGNYTVTVTDANGCTDIANGSINIGNPDPIANFYADPERTTVLNTLINFFDLTENSPSQWSWTFFDKDNTNILGTATEQNPSHTYPETDTGTYPVHLHVTTNAGCVHDTTLYVYIDGIYNLYVPNAFSPNGDGHNDEFFPVGIGVDENNFSFMIFDRWGELIWQTTTYGEKWDGRALEKTKKERTVQEGVYVWKINTVDVTRQKLKREYVGHVTLIK